MPPPSADRVDRHGREELADRLVAREKRDAVL
jgi:hypothetical protein